MISYNLKIFKNLSQPMQTYLISLFNIQPKEHGKHTDIRTNENVHIPSEQTWMEYKQTYNSQNEYPHLISDKGRVKKGFREQEAERERHQ